MVLLSRTQLLTFLTIRIGYIAMRFVTERFFGWTYRVEPAGPQYRAPANGKPDSGRTNGRVTDIDLEMSALVGDRF